LTFTDRNFRVRFGYSRVADKADFIVPWRAFPSRGYTRPWGRQTGMQIRRAIWLGETYSHLKILDLR